ncbi:MAG: hypothetical protein KIS71_02575 [Bacteroidetes bacterium]|nr:hypothetical protein [Bacteroidota bacterium]
MARDKIRKDLLFDLVVIRILEPASKLRSITLLEQYFGTKHRRQTFTNLHPKWLNLKDKVEGIVMSFAKQNYAFNFDVLFMMLPHYTSKLSKKMNLKEWFLQRHSPNNRKF